VELASSWAFRENYWYKYRIPGHHLLLIESGRIDAITPNGRLVARAGDLLCFRPTEHNEYGNAGPTNFYQTHINFAAPPRDQATPWLDELGPLPLHVTLGDAFDSVRQVFETLCMELPQSGAAHRLRVQGAVYELLAIIADASSRVRSRPPALDAWQRVRLRLGSQLNTQVRVDALARQMGISTDHFIRQFKQRFGSSPKAYRTHAKMREAARLLRAGDRSVKSVAYALGFPDTKSFTRIFKRSLGLVPSQLRSHADTVAPLAGQLYPINQHVVPPHAGTDWFDKWLLLKATSSRK
jgi:AraC-like DNA-binding protein